MNQYIEKHAQILRRNAAECTVLLKKDGSFPLEKPCKIALYGSGARKTIKGGTGSGDVNCTNFNSIEQALTFSGFTVTTTDWLDAYDRVCELSHVRFVADIKARSGGNWSKLFNLAFGAIPKEIDYDIPLNGTGDACAYVLSRNSGEGNDRIPEKGGVYLTDTEVRDILTLNAKFEKFILVLNVGGVVDLTPINNVKNILILSQLGVVTGDVFTDIILGKANPSGKLTTTWAKFGDYQTIGDFGDKNDTRYKEGIYVGYRYFDTANVEPLYSFGYGLSYTEFSSEVVSVKNIGSKINVEVKIKNTGKFAGKEVVQIYVTSPDGKLNKPYQTLVAYKKTSLLSSNDSETVCVSFDLKDVASYCEKCASFVLEQGDYIVRVGNSSRKTAVAAIVKLAEQVIAEKVKNALGKPDFVDAVIERNPKSEDSDRIIRLSAADFTTVEHSYKIDKHINPVIKNLTDEQLIHFCIGAYLPKSKLSVLGSSACHVCGAAGETSNYVYDITGGKYLVLSDGPAGLRIAAKYTETDDSGLRTVYDKFDGIADFLPDEMKKNLYTVHNTPEDKIKYQPTTAIPIGTAIAQSWNIEFSELCGDIVGSECEIFGCHFWLAPAMNIHRSILCGRNFEYYSEDPVVSGYTATGIVRGVQKHKNIGTTIKHFCANNQERNRYHSNSIVSERALREIYLKGFEICVKSSSPKAIMTSYNLINGEHTAQREDLIDGILRGEWGYKGFVMTDWVTTGHNFDTESKHDGVYAHKIVNAGNDIVCPGGDADFDNLTEALRCGNITREQLQICATRVYEAIMENNG